MRLKVGVFTEGPQQSVTQNENKALEPASAEDGFPSNCSLIKTAADLSTRWRREMCLLYRLDAFARNYLGDPVWFSEALNISSGKCCKALNSWGSQSGQHVLR